MRAGMTTTLTVSTALLPKPRLVTRRSDAQGIIAEGVETEAQQDFLVDSGCHAFRDFC